MAALFDRSAVLQNQQLFDKKIMHAFKNMQHAIVEIMNELGQYSPYGDNSVRSKELFARVSVAPIEVDGVVDVRPHRFSIFTSALSGRRSAAELFESVEDASRLGAWWRLRMPYEEALARALQQKGFTAPRPRVRQPPDSRPARAEGGAKPPVPFIWDDRNLVGGLRRIRDFSRRAFEFRERHKQLRERSGQLADEVARLRQIVPQEVVQMVDVYRNGLAICDRLRQQLADAEKRFVRLTDDAMRQQERCVNEENQ
jgi:hypothetical protein